MTEHDNDIFLRAIDVLAERGWRQGGFWGADGSVCILGAIRTVSGDDMDVFMSAWRSLDCSLGRAAGLWNDAPERTYEDVVLALKRASVGERVA